MRDQGDDRLTVRQIIVGVVALVLAACAGAAVSALWLGSREAHQQHVWQPHYDIKQGAAVAHALRLTQVLNSSVQQPLNAEQQAQLEHVLMELQGDLHKYIKSPPSSKVKATSPGPGQRVGSHSPHSTPKSGDNAKDATPREPGATLTAGLPVLKMPVKWAHVPVDAPLAADTVPKTLASVFPGGSAPADSGSLSLHWVITSCERYQWGRMLAHTLLSGLFNGLKPYSISIVWCKKYEEHRYPSLLRNLRHSHSINIFFPNDALLANTSLVSNTEAIYITALMVPKSLGRPDLPLLITEDDIMLAPDANLRLSNALAKVKGQIKDDPCLIQAYSARGVGPAPTSEDGITQPSDDLGNAGPSHSTQRTNIVPSISYGSQANFFTPALTALMLHHMLDFLKPGTKHEHHLQDMHIMHMLKDSLHCNHAGSGCWYYTMLPSLVQHIGTSSSLFNTDADHKLNQRWHFAYDFPVRISLPGYEPDGMWRRRLSAQSWARWWAPGSTAAPRRALRQLW